MSARLEVLCQQVKSAFGFGVEPVLDLNEVAIDVPVGEYIHVMTRLRDDPEFAFAQLIDLSGIDYSEFSGWSGPRFGVVSVLLSLRHNRRIRVRVFAADDEFPVVPSVQGVWNGVNWYEREAFDMYGIHFDGHDDLRRILTDYGFVGHPLRKDFPVSGHVEMRYDPEQMRVVYQPVTVEPRDGTPRVVREENYGKVAPRA